MTDHAADICCHAAEHAETFMDLFYSAPHWFFELFLMALFDGVIGMVAWPFIKRYWANHHKHDNQCGPVAPPTPEPEPKSLCEKFGCIHIYE